MKIGILTRLPNYYTETRLAEEAEKRGHAVEMLRYPSFYVALSSGAGSLLRDGVPIKGLDAVIPRSLAGSVTYGLAVLRQLETDDVYTTAKSLAIARSVDMLRSINILSRKGVDIPRTVFLREPSQADELIDFVGLPAVIRVPVSGRRGGNSTVLTETKKAVSSVIRAFYVSDATFIMQEYIQDEDAENVRVYVVGSSVVASAKRGGVSVGDQATSAGDQLIGIAVLSDAQKKVAVKAARALGLNCCTVDMIVSPDRSVVVGVDVFAGIEALERVTKRNIAGKIIEYIEQNARRSNKKDRVGA